MSKKGEDRRAEKTYDSIEEWCKEGERRFGPDHMEWEFVCPVCGHVAKTRDWLEVGAPQSAVAFSCVGRWMEGSRQAFGEEEEEEEGETKTPCNYAGGGFFRLNPIEIKGRTERSFAFAPLVAKEKTDE